MGHSGEIGGGGINARDLPDVGAGKGANERGGERYGENLRSLMKDGLVGRECGDKAKQRNCARMVIQRLEAWFKETVAYGMERKLAAAYKADSSSGKRNGSNTV